MIIRTEDLKQNSKYISYALEVSSSPSSTNSVQIKDVIQIKTVGGKLHFYVTDREYFLDILASNDTLEDNIDIIVDARVFTRLVSSVTTDTIEFNLEDDILTIKADGVYKLPRVSINDTTELSSIDLENVVYDFEVESSVLKDIFNYNAKQFDRGDPSRREAMRYCYVDGDGAITFTQGACVNNFKMAENVKLLFSRKIISLFRLFSADGTIRLQLSQNVYNDKNVTVIRFSTDGVELTSMLPIDDSIMASVPVSAIRGMAEQTYDYEVSIDKQSLLNTINRYFIVGGREDIKYKPFIYINFDSEKLSIEGLNGAFVEDVHFGSENENVKYTACVDIFEVQSILSSFSSGYITIKFGNGKALVFCSNNISNITPEVYEK